MDVLDTATGAVVEGGVDRLLNMVFDTGAHAYGKALVALKIAFKRYLENAIRDKNTIRTIATGDEDHPRHIRGENPLYVPIGLEFQKKEYDTTDIASLLAISNHLLVVGSGGMGKSMLMRYLFLKTAEGEEYIPILLDLNRIRRQESGEISVLELVYSCMAEYDVSLPKAEFESTLRVGRYLLLFDGFDEIASELSRNAADAIQNFCKKYPNNPCIITSRPDRDELHLLRTFFTLHSMPLKKWQAVELAKRIWAENERTKEFCRQLNETLFDDERYMSFAENPLLLTMMFLTFMHNLNIPDHLCDFYQSAFDALYNVHDNRDKSGLFRREFQCKSLEKKKFQAMFSYFCFQSYFKDNYEFTKGNLLAYLEKTLAHFGAQDFTAEAYLSDLQNIVCMIARDGSIYRFSHRSFQAYFAACYTRDLPDETQRTFFSDYFSSFLLYKKRDYFTLLHQLAPERFAVNAIENGLRSFCAKVDADSNSDLLFLRSCYSGIALDRPIESPDVVSEGFISIHITTSHDGSLTRILTVSNSPKPNNLVFLFEQFICDRQFPSHIPYCTLEKYLDSHRSLQPSLYGRSSIEFEEIDSSPFFTDEDRNAFFQTIIDSFEIPQTRAAIRDWLAEQDKKRERLDASSSDLSALLDAL